MKGDSLRRAVVVCLTTLGVACASTVLERSWVKPDIGALTFKKTVAVALTRDESRRRLMEDAMVVEIQRTAPDVQAVASYVAVPDLTRTDAVRSQFEQRAFDSAVVMRVTDVRQTHHWVPGSADEAPETYRTFWGYFGYWTPVIYAPEYVDRGRDVQVETEVYAFVGGGGDLVYAALSQTVDPTSSTDLVNGVTSVVSHDLKEKGLFR
jgi:hypothetical protein